MSITRLNIDAHHNGKIKIQLRFQTIFRSTEYSNDNVFIYIQGGRKKYFSVFDPTNSDNFSHLIARIKI